MARKHLKHLDRIFFDDSTPVFFITICSDNRRPVLTKLEIAMSIKKTFYEAEEVHGWRIGKYVIMPDHAHFFCAHISGSKSLKDFIRDIKKRIVQESWKTGMKGKIWQDEFFDHLLRNDESYEQKCEYIIMNPVRAGLCHKSEDWLYQGNCGDLSK